MPLLTTLGMIVGGAGAVKQFIDGSKAASSGRDRLRNLQEPELTNLAKNLKPSFEQERLAMAGISQQEQTLADVASGMDAASAMGLLQSGFNQTSQSRMNVFGQSLEKQFQTDLLAMQEDQTIRGLMEDRYKTEKASAEAEVMSGLQMQTGAVTDIATGLISAGSAQEAALAATGAIEGGGGGKSLAELRKLKRTDRKARRQGTGKYSAQGEKTFMGKVLSSLGGLFVSPLSYNK